jgi:hypothetical protein
MTMDGVSHLPFQLMAVVYPEGSNPGVFADFSVFPNKFFTRPWQSVGYSLKVTGTGSGVYPTTIVASDSTDYMQFLRVVDGVGARVTFTFTSDTPWVPDPSKDIRFPSFPSSISIDSALWGQW